VFQNEFRVNTQQHRIHGSAVYDSVISDKAKEQFRGDGGIDDDDDDGDLMMKKKTPSTLL
jgi:hypothetical protein